MKITGHKFLNPRNHYEALRQLGIVNHNCYEFTCERRLILGREHSKSFTYTAKYKVNCFKGFTY